MSWRCKKIFGHEFDYGPIFLYPKSFYNYTVKFEKNEITLLYYYSSIRIGFLKITMEKEPT